MKRLLLLPGMNPHVKVFDKLSPLLPHSEVVHWISPEDSSTISEYANLLVERLELTGPCDVLGVSFGGLVAQELAPLLGAGLCFVVASAATARELSIPQRVFRHLPAGAIGSILGATGNVACNIPIRSATPATLRARKLGSKNNAWYRWATSVATRWEPPVAPLKYRLVQIHGNRDKTFPKGHHFAEQVIAGGGHLISISHAQQVHQIVQAFRSGAVTQ